MGEGRLAFVGTSRTDALRLTVGRSSSSKINQSKIHSLQKVERLTGQHSSIGNFGNIRRTASNVRHHVVVFVEPAVASHFEQVGAFSRVGNQNASQKVSSVWSYIFRECQGSCGDVFVQKVDVVAFGVCRIVVER
jgi:hypothetical protein